MPKPSSAQTRVDHDVSSQAEQQSARDLPGVVFEALDPFDIEIVYQGRAEAPSHHGRARGLNERFDAEPDQGNDATAACRDRDHALYGVPPDAGYLEQGARRKNAALFMCQRVWHGTRQPAPLAQRRQ